MQKVSLMYCALCQKPHDGTRLKEGWFARGYKNFKHCDVAQRLICPDCLQKIASDCAGVEQHVQGVE